MLSSVLDKFRNAILHPHTETGRRKRPLSCDMDYSDDDSDIDILETPKRVRLEKDYPATTEVQHFPWNPPVGRVAEWIVRTKTKFQESYFIQSVMRQVKIPFIGTQQPPPIKEQNITVDIIDENSEDDEPEVVYEALASGDISHSKSLLRPPLARKSEIGVPVKESCRSNGENKRTSSRKRNIQEYCPTPVSESLGRSGTVGYTPIYEKFFPCRRPESGMKMRESSHLSVLSSSWQTTTARECIRLEEREKFRQLLNHFSIITSPAASKRTSPVEEAPINHSKVGIRTCNSTSKRGSFVTMQKLDDIYKQGLKERVKCVKVQAKKLSPGNDVETSIPWVHTSSPEIEVIERKIHTQPDIEIISGKMKSTPIVSLKKTRTHQKESNDCKVVDISNSSCCKLMQDQALYESPYLKENWLHDKLSHYKVADDIRNKKINKQCEELKKLEKDREDELRAKFQLDLTLQEIPPLPDDEEVVVVEKLPELTPEMLEAINDALRPNPPNEVLVDEFRLQVSRKDIETLSGLNWLNDEVVNFYFNLLMERGKLDNFPSVYSCNTFFYPKLMSGGHASLKRWTRKIDIFSHDLILVPVHLGMHWCLAVVDFRSKTIKYYDSMGGENSQCLNALKCYLEAESLDKKNQKLDTSDWTLETVKDKPNQLNGSDCGMFTCKYAEYICRDAKFTFTQEDMPYFRKRMVYEIVKAKLL